ncbi:Phosphatidylinositol-3-phosphatase SAC1 [Malassezia vespertilionis]|uniref:Phosphatidylinositol-3-phosphatase SAC1 n=1 Tax=Malassezia vespertilionis TaxID=2020962 RepID=UPI0024B20368|nr:Phosphatidylinositol-3-phosphatase SAC1 [Malassezia vespertilionis]WFD05190.1 Phosphatidylinositol-3-phosphatase SAC1 [Malassezia vespertilionis]
MYADREEALRGMPHAAPAYGGTSNAQERERELQEQLRQRAADSRQRPLSAGHASPEEQNLQYGRTERRRGGHEGERARYSYDRRSNMDDGRGHDNWRRNEYTRRRSRSPNVSVTSTSTGYESRSVFCSRLSAAVGQRDLGELFEEKLGENAVASVHINVDFTTGNSNGTAYVELNDGNLAHKALQLTGETMFGKAIAVQPVEAARTHASFHSLKIPALETAPSSASHQSYALPTYEPQTHVSSFPPNSNPAARLYVGNLHFDIASEHVRAVFEPFGGVEDVEVYFDNMTGKSKGFAFVQFKSEDQAHLAMEQLNGFELAGRPLRIGTSNARVPNGPARPTDSMRHYDSGARNATNPADKKFALMEKLARVDPQSQEPVRPSSIPRATTSALALRNMFDPATETGNWAPELQEEIRVECENFGKVLSVFVDKESVTGEVFVSFADAEQAERARSALTGRFFAGRRIEANLYVIVSDSFQRFCSIH